MSNSITGSIEGGGTITTTVSSECIYPVATDTTVETVSGTMSNSGTITAKLFILSTCASGE